MDKKNLWEQFESTGTIESYMRYKGILEYDMKSKADELLNDENAWVNY